MHPDNPGLCLKISRRGVTAIIKQRHKLLKFVRPSAHFNPNHREWRAYQKVGRHLDDAVWQKHIPRCHGFVETDLGEALAFDLLRNADGSIAPTLRTRLIKQPVGDSLLSAYQEFVAFIDRLSFISDLSIDNIVCVRLPCGGERISVVDVNMYDFTLKYFLFPQKAGRRTRRRLDELRVGLELLATRDCMRDKQPLQNWWA